MDDEAKLRKKVIKGTWNLAKVGRCRLTLSNPS